MGRFLIFLLVGGLTGCWHPVKPSIPTSPSQRPVPLDKTLGQVSLPSSGGIQVQYADIFISLDPKTSDRGCDYLLLSGVSSAGAIDFFPRYQKIISPPALTAHLNEQGYAQVKGLSPGRMMQLTKGSHFLFIRAMEGVSVSSGTIQSYLLEFDNGRNVFLSGGLARPDDVRPFLYQIRDEGKEIHLGIFPEAGYAATAEIIGLLQPQVAVFVSPGYDPKDKARFSQLLVNQLFAGSLFWAKPGETFPF